MFSFEDENQWKMCSHMDVHCITFTGVIGFHSSVISMVLHGCFSVHYHLLSLCHMTVLNWDHHFYDALLSFSKNIKLILSFSDIQ